MNAFFFSSKLFEQAVGRKEIGMFYIHLERHLNRASQSPMPLEILSEKYYSVPVLPVEDHKGDSAHTLIQMYSSERWQL